MGALTRKDLRASATRNAASMVSNCSDLCNYVGRGVYGKIKRDGRRLSSRDGPKVKVGVCAIVVVEEERLYWRDRRFSHPQSTSRNHIRSKRAIHARSNAAAQTQVEKAT